MIEIMVKKIVKKNIIIFCIVIALALIFWSSAILQDYFQQAAGFLENYGATHPVLSVLIFVGLSILSAMLISFSTLWLVPAAVVLWDNPTTVLLLLASWLIGGTLSYLIGRYGGYPVLKKLIPAKKLDYYENFISQKISFGILFLLRLVLTSEIPGYILGMARYPFGKYLLITILSEIPYAIYTVYAINSIIEKRVGTFVVMITVWLAAVILAVYLYNKKVKAK